MIAGSAQPFLPPATPPTIAKEALAAAVDWAGAHKTTALIVLRHGKVELEHYWSGQTPDAIATSRALSRSIPPLLLGFAVAEGKVALTDRADRWLTEWRGDPRGAITVQQLAENASGLESATISFNPYGNKFARIAWAGDVNAAALDHDLVEPPGSRFAVVNPNAQLLALILERAMGAPLQQQLSQRIWKPIGAADATFQLDRPGGSVRAMCCLRATPRDWARVGELMLRDGVWQGRRVLPAGWVARMAMPSARFANFGAGLWLGSPYVAMRGLEQGKPGVVRQSEPFLADDVRFIEGGGNRVVFFVPSRDLVVVRLGLQDKDWDQSVLVNTIIRGMRR